MDNTLQCTSFLRLPLKVLFLKLPVQFDLERYSSRLLDPPPSYGGPPLRSSNERGEQRPDQTTFWKLAAWIAGIAKD